MKKTFLLGIGCQKGGTTWLHDYINSHENTDMGFEKEYHIFDALFIPECRWRLDNLKRRAINAALAACNNKAYTQGQFILFKRMNFVADLENYFDYFLDLVSKSDDILLTGDITPTYAMLPESTFSHIKERLEARNFNVKVVYLMRDPIERVISAIRMKRKERYAQYEGYQFDSTESQHVHRSYKKDLYDMQTRYDRTIKVIESVFKPEDIFYAFYEKLFEDDTIKKLTSFLSLPYKNADFSKMVNVSKTENNLEPEIRAELADYFGDTYDFMAHRFGEEMISDIWKNYRLYRRNKTIETTEEVS